MQTAAIRTQNDTELHRFMIITDHLVVETAPLVSV
jgi:hypothetical protein